MSLIDKLEDLVVKVDTEYQEKMEAVIREIVPGMPEGNVRHAAECMCTDRMGSMMDIDIYILKEEDRPYECHYLKDLLEDRVARIAKMHGGQIRNRRLYCQRSRPVPKAVFRAGRGGQWVHYFVALVRESKGDHRGGGDEEMS